MSDLEQFIEMTKETAKLVGDRYEVCLADGSEDHDCFFYFTIEGKFIYYVID